MKLLRNKLKGKDSTQQGDGCCQLWITSENLCSKYSFTGILTNNSHVCFKIFKIQGYDESVINLI